MRNARRFGATILLALTLSALQLWAQGKPAWVVKRPADPLNYVGIGAAQKNGDDIRTRAMARENALTDIASQITVTIHGEQTSRVSERLNAVSEEFESLNRSTTRAELEGVETVDTWENETECWVYLRLSKAAYAAGKKTAVENATRLAVDRLLRGREAERQGAPLNALRSYLQALSAVEKYVAEPITWRIDGREVYVVNDLFASIQSLLDKFRLTAVNAAVAGKRGEALSAPLLASVTAPGRKGLEPVAGAPVAVVFLRGSGEMLPRTVTGTDGIARVLVTRMTGSDPIQLVGMSLDLAGAAGQDSVSDLFRTELKGFTVPRSEFTIRVAELAACVESHERLFGDDVAVPRLESLLKSELTTRGWKIVPTADSADLVVRIEASARRGSEVMGLCVAFVDASVVVQRRATGEEIYKNSVSSVKGISDTFEKAGMKAFDETAAKMKKEVVPAMVAGMGL